MKTLLLSLVTLVCIGNIQAQTKSVSVVLDVTSSDEETQKSALRHLKAMVEAYPDSEFELVVYGSAISMVLKSDSPFADKIAEFDKDSRGSVKVCQGTMKRYEVSPDQLLPTVQMVPDAIMEIATKQNQGWGYIKETKN